jgi:AcrR family transcriptional regulator
VTEQTGRAAMDERVDERRTNTREQIRTVALEMFAERGYDGTSLREIAEQLGVTKAALYFHFRTKEEILTAILRGYLDGIADLVAQAEAEPRSPERQERVLRSFAAHQEQWGSDLTLLVRQNATEIHDLPVAAEIKNVMHQVIAVLAPPGADAAQRLRVRTALTAFQVATLTAVRDEEGSEAELREAALALALEIVRGPAMS